MSFSDDFHPDSESPDEQGWYEIRRADGSVCVRAYVGWTWWIPLVDGWLSSEAVGFKWRGPVAEISIGDRSPLAECREVEAAIGIKDE
jgi:hypothetical protein